jgi:5-methylcytosine-specific restriction endonuclease McrA
MARTADQVLADQQRLRPDGLKWCKRRGQHTGPIPLTAFWPAIDTADGLNAVCKTCSTATFRRRAEKHWRAIGLAFQCIYCGGPYEHVDHVIPRILGGTDDVHNLVPACAPCNQAKASRPFAVWRPDLILNYTP